MPNNAIPFLLKKIGIFLMLLLAWSCQTDSELLNPEVTSPSGDLRLSFSTTSDGEPVYAVFWKGSPIIDTSSLGMEFLDMAPLSDQISIQDVEMQSVDETWEMVWGEQARVRNHYNQLLVSLREEKVPNRTFQLEFKIYNDGLGFRYLFPEQEAMDSVAIMDENTAFRLTGDHMCWWIPGDWDSYEHLYNTTRFSNIDALSKRTDQIAQSRIPDNAVSTPVSMKTDEGLYLSFHEANLTDYAGMKLRADKENQAWVSELVGSPAGHKARVTTPFQTPWRTIQVAEKAGDLIESRLIVNLNEPNKLNNIDWIEPMKYVGIWWELHLGKTTWGITSGRHGATTENAKRYIDFAAQHNIKGLLVEGWNTGWDGGVFDFVTPYEDYDLDEVIRYGRQKGVELIAHHENYADVGNYEKNLDTAFSLLRDKNIKAIKSGYVGQIRPSKEFHHGQYMVNHYRKVLETAAASQVMVNAHEPIKPTGLRRTYPNMMSREGVRGQEFNAWAKITNPPEHTVIVPFTRMLAGPLDFTPGIFDLKFDAYKDENQVNTTLTKQLALYVVLYSPLQMAADLPENYQGHPALQFIEDVGVDWDTTLVLNGEIGDYITIVRKEKGTENWFLGSITDEYSRDMELALEFLPQGRSYRAVIYRDAEDAHWDDNPLAYVIEEKVVDRSTTLELKLAAGGGTAISFFPQ